MLYEKLLNEEYVYNLYQGIENNRRIPISHGFKHIHNVLEYSKRLAEVFKLKEDEREMLFAAAVMHDIAQAFLQHNHAYNGAILAKEMLENNESISVEHIKKTIDIDRVCNIIKNHGGKKKEDYQDQLSALLILADKLDITKDRLKPRYKEFEFLYFMEKIDRVDIELKDNVLRIIITSNVDITYGELNKCGGIDKIDKILNMFDERFNLEHEIIINR